MKCFLVNVCCSFRFLLFEQLLLFRLRLLIVNEAFRQYIFQIKSHSFVQALRVVARIFYSWTNSFKCTSTQLESLWKPRNVKLYVSLGLREKRSFKMCQGIQSRVCTILLASSLQFTACLSYEGCIIYLNPLQKAWVLWHLRVSPVSTYYWLDSAGSNMQNSFARYDNKLFKVCLWKEEKKSSWKQHCRLRGCQIKSTLLLLLLQRFSIEFSLLTPRLSLSMHLMNNNWAISSSKDINITTWAGENVNCDVEKHKDDEKKVRDKFLTSPVVVI